MATKLYLHATTSGLPSGTLPTSEQSTLTVTSGGNFEADQTTNRLMNTTIGVSQANLSKASIADTNANNYYIGRWVSPLIYQSQISARTWTVEYGAKESNAAANFPRSSTGALYTNVYVWKPSDGTKVGTIIDGNSNADGEEASTTQTVINYTFSGSAVTGITPGDACIVVEIWAQVTQGNGTSRTDDFYYDGTTENSTSSEAAFISTPEGISFSQAGDTATPCYSSDGSSGTATTANTTEYWSVCGSPIKSTTESDVQIIFRTAGTLKFLQIQVKSNSIAGTTTFTLRKNAGDGNQVVSVPSTSTGLFEDTLNTDSVSATDKISIKSVPGAATNTITPTVLGCVFVASSGTIQKFASTGSRTISSASSTNYGTIYGNPGQSSTESNSKVRFRQAGTMRNLSVNVISNARTTATTFTSRNNGSDGNLTISVGSGASGFFEDITHSDSVASNTDYNFKTVTSTGTENLVFTGVSFEFEHTNEWELGVCPSSCALGASIATSQTVYLNIIGFNRFATTENTTKITNRLSKGGLRFYDMNVVVGANTISAASTLTFRKNGSDGNNTISITASTSGLFTDYAHTDTVSEGDQINYKMVTGGTGTSITILVANIHVQGNARVSQSGTYKYNILSRLSLSRIYKYNLIGRISLSRIYKYHVQARITLSRIYKYHIVTRISQSRIYKYHVQARISLSRIYKYHLLGRISLSRIHKYNLLGHVSLSRVYKYHLLGRISLARQYLYHIQSRVSLSRIYKYHLLGRISLSQSYKYHVANLVSLSRVYKYNVLSRVSLSRVYLWNLLGRISKSSSLIYNIFGRVSLARIYKYHIQGRVSVASILKYNILGRISVSAIYKYNMNGRVSLARTYLYNVIGRISQSQTYKYDVIGRISLAQTYLWNVLEGALTRISMSQIYKYNVIARVSKQQIYLYNILSRVSQSSIYKWDLITRVSLSRVYKYHILQRISLPSILKYNVLHRLSLSNIYKYNIHERVSLSRTYKYNLIGRISRSLTTKYNLLGRVSLSKIYRYNITNLVSKAQTYKYNVIGRISLVRIYKYNLISRISSTKIYKWDILQRVSRTRTYLWNLTNRVSISTTFKWNILNRISSFITLRWDIELFRDNSKRSPDKVESKQRYPKQFDRIRSYLHRPQSIRRSRGSRHTRG